MHSSVTRFLLRPIGLICLLGVVSCGHSEPRADTEEAWNRANRPQILSGSYQTKFDSLPTQGTAAIDPWSDSYWPSHEGGIASRWNDPSETADDSAWTYTLHSREELLSLGSDRIATLSPAEKFDIFAGRYDYPLVARERSSKAVTNDTWWGICHGWAPAAFNFAEPKPVVVKNADGIEIPFGASDVKALLSFRQAESGRSVLLGQRCNKDLSKDFFARYDPACRDTNAGSFHIVLANQLGLQRKAFAMDVTRDIEVWNQPVSGFETRNISRRWPHWGAAWGTVAEYEMVTDVSYVVEMAPSWKPHVGVDNAHKVVRYRYFLEVNFSGEIIGGSWVSEERPDFLWNIESADLTGFFAPLKALYEASTRP